jgi:long-chain acyl-CoA synthetase
MYDHLGQVMPQGAAKHGDRVALVFHGEELTYRRLDELTARLANGLQGLGVGLGDRVTLYSQNCWEWIVGYYAVLRLGGVVNPINVMLTPDEVVYVTGDCGAKALLASAEKGSPILDRRAETPLEHIVLSGEEVADGATSFDRLVVDSSPEFADVEIDPSATSTIGYTSGTDRRCPSRRCVRSRTASAAR